MMVVRPAKPGDLAAILKLAKAAGVGLTTLPADPDIIKSQIKQSRQAFAKNIRRPVDERYLFGMEVLIYNGEPHAFYRDEDSDAVYIWNKKEV